MQREQPAEATQGQAQAGVAADGLKPSNSSPLPGTHHRSPVRPRTIREELSLVHPSGAAAVQEEVEVEEEVEAVVQEDEASRADSVPDPSIG